VPALKRFWRRRNRLWRKYGFGKLSDLRIAPDKLAELQVNLVRSHAGVLGTLEQSGIAGHAVASRQCAGEGIQRRSTSFAGIAGRAAQCRRASGRSGKGLSGSERRPGSFGASGARVNREGEAFYRGERIAGREALRSAGLQPLQLSAKEGLALLNGTQAMTAVGALAVARAQRVVRLADLAGAMSLEALMAHLRPSTSAFTWLVRMRDRWPAPHTW